MRNLLNVDSAHLRDLLDALGAHHRVARSLDFLGSILKVVAGTPDASDLQKSRVVEARLIDANNRQIEINTKIQSQINKLTATVNLILKAAKASQIDSGHLYETLLARNRMLMMELQNLMLAVTLAKMNIVSPNILDHADKRRFHGRMKYDNIGILQRKHYAGCRYVAGRHCRFAWPLRI
jgi:hypothetical protein